MASEWKSTTLKEPLEFSNGRTSPVRIESGQFQVFGSNGAIGRASEANSPARTIIIGRVGSYCGSLHYSHEPCWVTDNAIKGVAKAGHNPEFLRYLLQTLDLNKWRGGSGQPLLNQSTLNAIPISLPPADEQCEIGAMLGDLDRRIGLIADVNLSLEAIARAIFKSWFVDFDPVRAKAEGREPEGMDAATAALFPELLNDGLPDGWARNVLGNISTVGIGKTPPRAQSQWFSESPYDVVWVSIRNMGNSGIYIRDSSEYLTREAIERFNVRIVPDNTVIVSFKLTVGRLAITDGEMTTNEAIAHCVLSDYSVMTPEYLYCALSAFDFKSLASTSSIAEAVNSKTVRNLSILVPPKPMIDAFTGIAQPLFQSVKNNQRLIATLIELRDTLLPRLISGKLRVPDAEKLVEAAL